MKTGVYEKSEWRPGRKVRGDWEDDDNEKGNIRGLIKGGRVERKGWARSE
jgi:hypothetical protein